MSPLITLHGATERVLQQLLTHGELTYCSIVISTDANTGQLVGRFIESDALKVLKKAHHLGRVLDAIDVYCFGLEPLSEMTSMSLKLQPVRTYEGSLLETNLSFFFDVVQSDTPSLDRCLVC